MRDGFEVILLEASTEIQELAKRTRALIKEIMPNVVEVPWPKQKYLGYGVGPKKMSEHFCYIGVFKNHINLGFNYGAELPDPENLLEGTGALFRHIKITKREQLGQAALYQLLEAATKHLPRLKNEEPNVRK